MAKQSKQQAVSMGRGDLEAGGFLNDRACKIDEAEATVGTSKSGKGGERAVVRILMTVEGMDDQVERNLSVGKGLVPADDGSCFYPEEGSKAKGIKKSSNYGRFLESLYEADTEEKINVKDITTDLAGIIFRALEIEEPPITEGDPPRRILTVAEILDEMPDEDEKPKKGKKPAKPAKDEDDEEEEEADEDDDENESDPVNAAAKEIIEELLSEKSPRKIDTLPALVLKAAAGNKKRREIVAQVQDAKWLAATFEVDKKKGTVSEAE